MNTQQKIRYLVMQARHGKDYDRIIPRDNPDDVADQVTAQLMELVKEARLEELTWAADEHPNSTYTKLRKEELSHDSNPIRSRAFIVRVTICKPRKP